MAQHTAGPWSVDARAGDITAPIPYKHEYFRDYIIATVHPDSVDDPEERVANAALLAAAPDLLEALEAFVEDVRRAYIGEQEDEMLKHSALAHNWPDLCVTYRKAQKAIAAAKGGQ